VVRGMGRQLGGVGPPVGGAGAGVRMGERVLEDEIEDFGGEGEERTGLWW